MKENTNQDGYNFFVCMSEKDELSKEKPDNFYPSLDYLKEIYFDWEIVKEIQDFTDIEEHDNLPAHEHNLIFLLAKKIAENKFSK